MIRKLLRRPGSDRGQAVVEFALAMPFLLMFILFIADVGFLAYSHINATSAVREGARCAAVGGTAAAVTTRVNTVGGGLATSEGVVVAYTPAMNPQAGDEVRVTADFSYEWITPVGLVGLDDLAFERSAAMRLETDILTKATC